MEKFLCWDLAAWTLPRRSDHIGELESSFFAWATTNSLDHALEASVVAIFTLSRAILDAVPDMA